MITRWQHRAVTDNFECSNRVLYGWQWSYRWTDEMDLGVYVTDDLKPSTRTLKAANKAEE